MDPDTSPGSQTLATTIRRSLQQAADFAKEQVREEGHWCSEFKSNTGITAEYLTLLYALKIQIPTPESWVSWLLSQQNSDGSWGLAPEIAGDVSVTVETYFALKVLGVSPGHPAMVKAKDFILSVGGVAQVRILTRIFLATFGLFSWAAVPELPAELILVPPAAHFSIYYMAAWARATVVPLLLISHHRPVFALPNGTTGSNMFLDELWCNPDNKYVPYRPSLWKFWKLDTVSFIYTSIDYALHVVNGMRNCPWRTKARQRCIDWILQHQEEDGGWDGVFPPMHVGVLALFLEGYSTKSGPLRRGLDAMESFVWSDQRGKRMQPCVSPVWDTILMTVGLIDAGLPVGDPYLERSIEWIKARQLLGPEGDWRVLNPNIVAGAFSFEYYNHWTPDVDDTAAAILAFVKQNPRSITSETVICAIQWIVGMQNKDGGWGAFDRENNKLFFNRIPFSDMGAMCDPSADITGRVLEAFGLVMKTDESSMIPRGVKQAMSASAYRAIPYLVREQEQTGAWFGRWGANYIYGTSNVLCGLAYFINSAQSRGGVFVKCITKGVDWLVSIQNKDGGWGETLDTYKDPSLAGQGRSTASQTAWALMGLLTCLPATNSTIIRGVEYLLSTQVLGGTNGGATWPESTYNGVGFPNHAYVGYSFYPHYFPMMALGQYASLIGCKPFQE